ncbi:GapS6b family protein [Shewanella sp. 1180_01]|uniref:GapS6b family protein n=1 Tax=Shewanella sp. 1180_01 TaxID=2604451 RepID=UPI0040646BC6
MVGAFEGWLLGYAGTKLSDKILCIFMSNPLISELHSAIDKWAQELPIDANLISSYALFPDHILDEDLKERKSLKILRSKLHNFTIPEKDDWVKALIEQWHFVKDKISSPQEFFLIDEDAALKHIIHLSDSMDIVCSKHDQLFKVTVIKLLRNIDSTKYIEAENLEYVSENILRDIRFRLFSTAKEKINILKNIESLNGDTRNLLSALSIKIELANGVITESKHQLTQILSTLTSNNIETIITSILIEFESKKQPEIARKRYNLIKKSSPYIEEVFFEFLANEEEIVNKYGSNIKYNLTEQELTGLARGAFRIGNIELAVEISNFLNESYPSSNSKTLILYLSSISIANKCNSKHYFLIEKNIQLQVESLIEQLIKNIDNQDLRYIYSLMNLLSITSFLDRRLLQFFDKHRDQISNINPDFINNHLNKKHQASEYKSRFELSNNEVDIEGYAELNLAVENNKISITAINKWLDNGGRIETGDDLFNSFLTLSLTAKICKITNKLDINNVKKLAENFLSYNIERYIEIHPAAVINLCDDFLRLDLPLCAVELLSILLPDSPWLSPIYKCYLNALLASEKYEILKNKLDEICFEDKSTSLWLIEAQLYQRLKSYIPSIRAAQHSIRLDANNAYSWYFLLFTSRLSGTSIEERKKIVFEIPEKMLETYCESKIPLINEIATNIDKYMAERILVDWFVQDPNEVASLLTQIHFSTLISQERVYDNPYVPIHCRGGVIYSQGFQTRNKVLVRNINLNHSSLLDADSHIGKLLEKMQVGETMENITLLERLQPYIAAFQLAIKIRDEINDGTDAFWLLTLPSDKEDFIPFMEKVFKKFSHNGMKQNDVLHNPNIPLVMKGHYANPNCPVKSAIAHLKSNDSNKYLELFDEGLKNPDRVVIDIYTAVYLSLIGAASTLSKSTIETVMTDQSKYCLEQWMTDITRDDYLSLDYTENGLFKYTAADVRNDLTSLIQELKELISTSQTEALNPKDTPENLIKIKDLIDATVYSTFQISVANDLPWLCIDNKMNLLASKFSYSTVNIKSIVSSLLDNTCFQKRKRGISLNLFYGAPVPIFYNDIIELSKSSSRIDNFLVYKFLEKCDVHSYKLGTNEITLDFLSEVVGNIIINGCKDGEIINGGRAKNASYDGYVEHIFNYCCRIAISDLEGDSTEERFAQFMSFVLENHSLNIREYWTLLSSLASSFATGHFLDLNELNRIFKK